MNKFINLRNGRVNVTSYRYVDHTATTLDDLIACAVSGSGDYLTADFTTDELCKHPGAGEFLRRYGITYASHRGTVVVLDWDAFLLLADNTVVVDGA